MGPRGAPLAAAGSPSAHSQPRKEGALAPSRNAWSPGEHPQPHGARLPRRAARGRGPAQAPALPPWRRAQGAGRRRRSRRTQRAAGEGWRGGQPCCPSAAFGRRAPRCGSGPLGQGRGMRRGRGGARLCRAPRGAFALPMLRQGFRARNRRGRAFALCEVGVPRASASSASGPAAAVSARAASSPHSRVWGLVSSASASSLRGRPPLPAPPTQTPPPVPRLPLAAAASLPPGPAGSPLSQGCSLLTGLVPWQSPLSGSPREASAYAERPPLSMPQF